MLFFLLLKLLSSRHETPSFEECENEVPAPRHEEALITAYVKDCKGCIGITKDGTVAESHKRILAADPKFHPMGTKVELTFPDGDVKIYTVRDTGGKIKGKNRFDMLVKTEKFAKKWGKKKIKFRVVDELGG
jgi:3D (Asp-Asp-Asp) domain-containing protein